MITLLQRFAVTHMFATIGREKSITMFKWLKIDGWELGGFIPTLLTIYCRNLATQIFIACILTFFKPKRSKKVDLWPSLVSTKTFHIIIANTQEEPLSIKMSIQASGSGYIKPMRYTWMRHIEREIVFYVQQNKGNEIIPLIPVEIQL